MKPACEPVLFSPLGSKSHSLFLASFNCTNECWYRNERNFIYTKCRYFWKCL